jgi:hypothetical protein
MPWSQHKVRTINLKKSIDYRLSSAAYSVKTWLLKKVPRFLVPRKKHLGDTLEIGITTYIDRYDLFFKPLYKQVRELFPEVRLRVVVNGFYKEEEQQDYLRRVESELCASLGENITFVLHDSPKGLTRLWNEILSQNQTEFALLLNDDLEVLPWFRRWLETAAWKTSHVTLLDGIWSHFVISSRALDDIGWFDEEFPGIGFEDMDYTARCLASDVEIANVRCPYLQHRDHKPVRTSFDDVSSRAWDWYSTVNQDHFFKKWRLATAPTKIYIKQLRDYVESTGYVGQIAKPLMLKFNKGLCYPDRQ